MKPESKRRLELVECATHEALNPLGFKKQKSIWRRSVGDVLQQFSIVSMQLGDNYRPEWGLNILSRREDSKPLPWKLQVRWTFEMAVANLAERLRYFDCLKFDVSLPDEKRSQLMMSLLQHHVIPCFEIFTTEESVRRMMGDRGHPLRAHCFVGLPDEWWPGGGRALSSGKLPPPIIRPWKRNGGVEGDGGST